MKILIVLPNDFLGGAEQYLRMVATFFEDQQVDIVFLKPEKTSSWSDLTNRLSLHYSSTNNSLFSLVSLCIFLLHNRKYDYVFTSHVYVTGIIGIFLRFGIFKKTHFIARESTSIFKRFHGFKLATYKLMYKFGYKMVDLLICQTDYMKEQLVSGIPELNNRLKIITLPNPIDLDLIKLKAKESLKEQIDGAFIVSAGRLIKEKGFDILIGAFAKLNSHSFLKLIILGEGQERQNLQRLIEHLKLDGRVILKGHVSNVYPYFKNAKLCVVSSRIEGFPNVLLQMMSQNTIIVSTLCAGGIDEIPGIYTTQPNNEELLGAAMIKALEEDTSANRLIFDSFLRQRSIPSFITQIMANLK